VPVSGSRGDEVGLALSLGDGMVIGYAEGGGGSIDAADDFVGTTGSGKAGIASSAEEVSMVICIGFLMFERWV
jgi:hypothetical protein